MFKIIKKTEYDYLIHKIETAQDAKYRADSAKVKAERKLFLIKELLNEKMTKEKLIVAIQEVL